MDIKFTKLQGAGNDYIAIDGRNFDHDWGQLSLEMSKPAFGVGSDGIVVVKNSDIAQIRMLVFNPDGTEAEMSGNGIRLFSKFVIDNNLAIPKDNSLRIETGGGVRTLWPKILDNKMISAKVAMGKAEFEPKNIPVKMNRNCFDIDILDRKLSLTCLSVGNPHAVTIIEDNVDNFPLVEIGSIIEKHEIFPNRINFEVVNILDRKNIRSRIFERGAGETLSSGTGSTASATASKFHNLVDDNVDVHLDGGILNISWDEDEEIYLSGPAVEVFTGIWKTKK